MPDLSLYNLIHGPEFWLGVTILAVAGIIFCVLLGVAHFISAKHNDRKGGK